MKNNVSKSVHNANLFCMVYFQCSVPCGNGAKTRSVDCKKKLADGNWTVLPDDQCYNKPPSIMPCNVMPCYAWRVEYPCASCGGKDFKFVCCFALEMEGVMVEVTVMFLYNAHIISTLNTTESMLNLATVRTIFND